LQGYVALSESHETELIVSGTVKAFVNTLNSQGRTGGNEVLDFP